MKKKVFIDCGAHLGESVDLFREMYQDHHLYEIHCFEPNQNMWEALKRKGVILHTEAVWVSNGTANFYLAKAGTQEGSTLVEGKNSGKVNYSDPHEVRTIDLSDWIMKTFDSDDYIILKIDIEGAEYNVLPKLFKTGAWKYVNEWYGELHTVGKRGKITSVEEKQLQLVLNILDDNGVDFKDWHNNRNILVRDKKSI